MMLIYTALLTWLLSFLLLYLYG